MARPKKKTVDYFPHIIKDGKTITILENRFGNDGYAFWFKLLEILGSTEGHSYRYENTANKEFLYAKTNVDKEKAEKILDLLAELEAIDSKLWEHNIIWSDNFIENIEDVYKKRSNGAPQKPVINDENKEENELSNQKHENKEVSEEKTPQSKLKETKLKKTKEKPSDKSDTQTDEFSIEKLENGRYNYPDKYERIYSLYPDNKDTKKSGWRKWAARRREGVPQEDLIEAVKNYAAECQKEDRPKKYVKHLSTFLGPDDHWKKYLGLDTGQVANQNKEKKKLHDINNLKKKGWNN